LILLTFRGLFGEVIVEDAANFMVLSTVGAITIKNK